MDFWAIKEIEIYITLIFNFLLFRDEHFSNEKICKYLQNTFGKLCEYELITTDIFESEMEVIYGVILHVIQH